MTEFQIQDHFRKLPVLDHGHVELIDGSYMDPMLKVVNAARVSFNKESSEFSDKDAKLIGYLARNNEFAPFRHSQYTIRIKAPLFVFRQLQKYQIGSHWLTSSVEIPESSWNEASGRYVEFVPEFYTPKELRNQSKSNKQASEGVHPDSDKLLQAFRATQEVVYATYQALVASGVAKEQARLLLPASLYSEAVWSFSLQTLIHVLRERLDAHAQFETREYALAIRELFAPFMEGLLPSA